MRQSQPVKQAQEIGEKILKVHPDFPLRSFMDAVASGADIVDALRAHLPTDYPKAVDILIRLLGPEHPSEEGMFKNHWQFQPFLRFVEKYGFDDFDASMRALYEITKR
ncbi:hypothetical protein HYR99_36590, partial [Candidatus Poribacteria bacterium]|nr:hypothetical protein [Candidatus Poribacteria bacterium]